MMIRRTQAAVAAAAALLGSLHAYASNKAKPVAIATDTYNFRCVGPTLDLTLSSFSLPFTRSGATASSDAAGAAGKTATTALTIEFPTSKAYSTLYSQIIRGDHYSSCTLVETVTVPASTGVPESSTVFTRIFSQVTPTAVTAIWKDGSQKENAANPGADIPVALVRATLGFTEVRFDDGSSSNSGAATDSWTTTQ